MKQEELAPVVEAFDNLFQTIQTKEIGSGVALFSLSNSANSSRVDTAAASTVVDRVVAAKKVWNVEIAAFDSFDALPSDVQETTKRQYGEKAAR